MKRILFTVITPIVAAYLTMSGIACAKTTEITIAAALPPKTFVVVKQTPTGEAISANELLVSVHNLIAQLIGVGNLGSTAGFGPDTASQAGINLEYDPQSSAFRATWKWAQALNHNYLLATIPVRVEDAGNVYRVTVDCPSTMQSDVLSFSLVGIPKWPNEVIGRKLNSACADTAAITLVKTAFFKGELNNEYKDAAIFANFQRMATPVSATEWSDIGTHQSVTEMDIEKSQKFWVKADKQSYLVAVSVFPYRNGSKVLYAYGYRYFVNSDGTTGYNQSDADSVKSTIVAIAND